MPLSMILLTLMLVLQAASPRLAGDLKAGMRLVYASDGKDQAPWSVESVETGLLLKGAADCARVKIRRQAAQTPPQETLCLESNTLYAWNATRETWTPQRPVGPHMELAQPRANGDTVKYVTGDMAEEVIGNLRVQVVITTVTTTDTAGQPRRRLTERYAVSLTTATGGRFDVPDASAANGWRTEQAFELRAVHPPSQGLRP